MALIRAPIRCSLPRGLRTGACVRACVCRGRTGEWAHEWVGADCAYVHAGVDFALVRVRFAWVVAVEVQNVRICVWLRVHY